MSCWRQRQRAGRAVAERDADLAEYHEMAERSGTTLAVALGRFIAMENLLRSDFDAGIMAVARNAGIDIHAWARRQLEAEPEAA